MIRGGHFQVLKIYTRQNWSSNRHSQFNTTFQFRQRQHHRQWCRSHHHLQVRVGNIRSKSRFIFFRHFFNIKKVSSSSSTPSSIVVPRTPPNQFQQYAMPSMNQLPCPVTRPVPQQIHHQPQDSVTKSTELLFQNTFVAFCPFYADFWPESKHRMTQQHHMAPPPQMQQIPHQTPPQGSGTSFDPILFKIVRQKATGTNTGVFFYFKIYDKVYRGRRDSFSKDKSIMYLRCNTCPRSVNKVSFSKVWLLDWFTEFRQFTEFRYFSEYHRFTEFCRFPEFRRFTVYF